MVGWLSYDYGFTASCIYRVFEIYIIMFGLLVGWPMTTASQHHLYTGCFFFLISFHKLISNRIPVQISSHFDSMFLSSS